MDRQGLPGRALPGQDPPGQNLPPGAHRDKRAGPAAQLRPPSRLQQQQAPGQQEAPQGGGRQPQEGTLEAVQAKDERGRWPRQQQQQPQGRPQQQGQGGPQEQRPQMPQEQRPQMPPSQQAQRQQPPSPPKQARGVPPPQQGPAGQPGLHPLKSHGGPHASSAGVNPQIGPGGYPMPMPNIPGMDPATMQAAVMAAQASMAQHQNFAAHQVMMQQMLHGQLSPHLQSHPSLMSHPMLHQNLPLMMAGGMPMYPALSHLAAMSGGVPMMNPGMNGLGAGTGVFMPSMQGMTPMLMDMGFGATGNYAMATLAIVAALAIGVVLLALLPPLRRLPDARARMPGGAVVA